MQISLWRAQGALVVIVTLLGLMSLSGCGGGSVGSQGSTNAGSSSSSTDVATASGGASASPTPTATPSTSGTIIVNQTLGAKVVPATVVNERFTGFDSKDAVVFGPAVRPTAAQIVLTVPLTVVRIGIEYLDAANNVVFVYGQAVAVTAGGTVTITDPDFTAPGAVPVAVVFSVQPTSVKTGAVMSPAVQVRVVDASSNTVTTASGPITLALGTNPTGAVLGGTLTRNAVNGVATFDDIKIDRFGTGFTLAASSTGLSGAISSAFNDTAVLSFAAPATFAAASLAAPQILAAADFNGDTKDDFAIVDSNQVLVFVSKGDGTFQNPVAYATDNGPVAMAAGDIDGDGKPDLAVACAVQVDILTGKGDGTFNAAASFATGNANSILKGIALGRLLQTSRLDIVVDDFNGNNSIWVYANNGNLNFTRQNYSLNNMIPGQPKTISVGDINGDGAPDLAIAVFTRPQVVVLNSASGVLATLFPNANVSNVNLSQNGGAAQGVLVGDFNGDGLADVFWPDDTPHNNLNDGNFFLTAAGGQLGSPSINNIGDDCFGVAKADFNMDGKPDIGCATAFGLFPIGNGDFEVLLGNGDGTFQPVAAFKLGDNNGRSIAVGDFNGDGLPDAVVAGPGGGAIFLNTSK